MTVAGTDISGDAATISTAHAYNSPEITDVKFTKKNGFATNALLTRGGEKVTVEGTCLGEGKDALAFTSSQNALNIGTADSAIKFCFSGACTMLKDCSHEGLNKISCTSVAGVGSDLKWSAFIAGQDQTTAPLLKGKFRPPTVKKASILTFAATGVLPPCCKTCGGGGKPCGNSCQASDAVCKTFGGCACESGQTTQRLIIEGEDFGQSFISPQGVDDPSKGVLCSSLEGHPAADGVSYSYKNSSTYRACACRVTKPFQEIQCDYVQPGRGAEMELIVTFGGQKSSGSSVAVSYEAASVLSLSGEGASEASTQGGQLISFSGRNFGPRCGVLSKEAGNEPCDQVEATYTNGGIVYSALCAVQSDTLMECKVVPGTGKDHVWTFIFGGVAADASQLPKTSYARPTVGEYDGPGSLDALTQGSQSVIIKGSNFGPVSGAPISAKYGPRDALEENDIRQIFEAGACKVVVPHTEIECFTVAGAGEGLSWLVTVDGQQSQDETTNYGKTELITISISTDFCTGGYESVVITGKNVGPKERADFLERVVFGPESNPTAYTADCTVNSHTKMTCILPPGMGSNFRWRATVRGQTSPPSQFKTSYSPPTIVTPEASDKLSYGTQGWREGNKGVDGIITIAGFGFGICDPGSVPSIEFGASTIPVFSAKVDDRVIPDVSDIGLQCPEDDSWSGKNQKLFFKIPEMNRVKSATVKVSIYSIPLDQTIETSTSFNFEYEDPVIVGRPVSRPGIGDTLVVTVSGKNFCASEACCTTMFKPTGLEAAPADVEYHSHDEIQFQTKTPGVVWVECGGVKSNEGVVTSEDPWVMFASTGNGNDLSGVTFETRGGDPCRYLAPTLGTRSPTCESVPSTLPSLIISVSTARMIT